MQIYLHDRPRFGLCNGYWHYKAKTAIMTKLPVSNKQVNYNEEAKTLGIKSPAEIEIDGCPQPKAGF